MHLQMFIDFWNSFLRIPLVRVSFTTSSHQYERSTLSNCWPGVRTNWASFSFFLLRSFQLYTSVLGMEWSDIHAGVATLLSNLAYFRGFELNSTPGRLRNFWDSLDAHTVVMALSRPLGISHRCECVPPSAVRNWLQLWDILEAKLRGRRRKLLSMGSEVRGLVDSVLDKLSSFRTWIYL